MPPPVPVALPLIVIHGTRLSALQATPSGASTVKVLSEPKGSAVAVSGAIMIGSMPSWVTVWKTGSPIGCGAGRKANLRSGPILDF